MTLDRLYAWQGRDHIQRRLRMKIALRKHILDMGLTPGTEVTMIKAAPLGDPARNTHARL